MGFAPFAAMVLGAAVLAPSARLAWMPAAAFLVSDLILNTFVYKTGAFSAFMLVSLAFYAALFLIARPLAARKSLALPFLGATVLGVLAFQLLANSVSWVMLPYAKTLAGFVQAQTTGLPGFAPAWTFLLKSLAGNAAFAGLFLLAMAPARQPARAATPVRA